jgi:hypothetical protein
MGQICRFSWLCLLQVLLHQPVREMAPCLSELSINRSISDHLRQLPLPSLPPYFLLISIHIKDNLSANIFVISIFSDFSLSLEAYYVFSSESTAEKPVVCTPNFIPSRLLTTANARDLCTGNLPDCGGWCSTRRVGLLREPHYAIPDCSAVVVQSEIPNFSLQTVYL